MGGKGGGEKYRVVDYYMSIHYGVCHGPVDALLGIYVKERDAWPGKTIYDDDSDQGDINDDAPIVSFQDFLSWITNGGSVPSATSSVAVGETALNINRPDLFGGEKKEGGVRGTAYFLPGGPTQVMPDSLASRLFGLTSATMPGFRGLASVLFYGGNGKGFMWAQNNPYLPPAWFTVFRKSLGLTASKATVQRGDNPPDSNPAHMIYECLTNTDWGMGAPTTIIDVTSFETSGDVFLAEKLGLSMIWNQQATIESFVTEILDHVQATLFVNPNTGLLTLKPIRADYVFADLPILTPDNCKATNRQRKAWAETINEIVVTWTNPTNEKEESVTFQDTANIAMQGGIVSDSRNYYGVRNAELASELGVRDLRSASYPLFGCDLEIDRTAWDFLPGDVVRLQWPEDNIADIVLRIGKIDYGRPGDPTIKVNVIEDIFALEKSAYVTPVVTGWVSPDEDPVPFAYTHFFTVPYTALAMAGLDSSTADDQYPRVVPGIFAQQLGSDTYSFELNGPKTLPNGTTSIQNLGSRLQTTYSETTAALPVEAQTLFTDAQLGALIGEGGPQIGGFLYVGAGTDAETEIIMLDDYNSGTSQWTLARGVMDTVPRAWPIGTPVWYVNSDFECIDFIERVAGQTVNYQLQPRTSKGLLPLDQAPVESVTLTARPYLPFRPADTEIAGSGFAQKVYTGARPSSVPVSWANRNRFMEDTIIRLWTDGNVTPEVGQTTTLALTGGWFKSVSPHRFWRVASDVTISIGEVVFRASEAGASLTSTAGGTPIESDEWGASETAAKAFDGTAATRWTGGSAIPSWVGWDFGAGNEQAVKFVDLVARSDGYVQYTPTDFRIEFSDDGVAWTTAQTFNTGAWSLGESRQFALTAQLPSLGYNSLAGTTYSIPYADFNGNRVVTIEFGAERDGMGSLQKAGREVKFDLYGYGNNYGNDYGENNGA